MAGGTRASLSTSVAIWILAALGTLWFLRAARSLLIPIALAILISYALEPLVAWLARHNVHRAIGSAAVLLAVLGALGGGSYALKDDLAQLVESLPKAADRARELVESQLGSSDEALGDVAGTSGSHNTSASEDGEGEATGTSGVGGGSLLQRAVSSVFAFAGHLVVVVFLVFGYLLVLLCTGALVGIATWLVLVIIKSVADHVERLRPVARLMAP